jgi:hypothetical protein
MIIGTSLRRGLILTYKKRPAVRIGTACAGSGTSSAAAAATAPFVTALVRPLESANRGIAPPAVRVAADRRPSSSSRFAMAPMTSSARVYKTMHPSLRAAIAADLRSVDSDMDGRIGAEELGALLRKHDGAFAEGEIVELSDLFYSSLGGSSVSINRFLEALDAASGGGGAATDGGLNALGPDGN